MDRHRFGRAIRTLRRRRGWRQQDIAGRAGVSRSVAGRIERGELGRIAYNDIERVAEAVDGRLGLDFWWRGADLDRLLDADHAAIVERLVGIYRDAGWQLVVEATFSEYGERGSVDVLAWHQHTGQVAVNEVKATIADAGGTVVGIDRKARLAPVIAKRLGWSCLGVSRFLVVAEGSTSRRRIAKHPDMFGSAFPLSSRASLAWIRSPGRPPVAGLLFLSPGRSADSKARSRGFRRALRSGTGSPPTPGARRTDD